MPAAQVYKVIASTNNVIPNIIQDFKSYVYNIDTVGVFVKDVHTVELAFPYRVNSLLSGFVFDISTLHSVIPAPAGPFVLLESGDQVLLESGDNLLLEG